MAQEVLGLGIEGGQPLAVVPGPALTHGAPLYSPEDFTLDGPNHP